MWEHFDRGTIERKILFFDHLLELKDKLDPASICESEFKLIEIPPAEPAGISGSMTESIEDAMEDWLQVVCVCVCVCVCVGAGGNVATAWMADCDRV